VNHIQGEGDKSEEEMKQDAWKTLAWACLSETKTTQIYDLKITT
jgi:hypothetical protein